MTDSQEMHTCIEAPAIESSVAREDVCTNDKQLVVTKRTFDEANSLLAGESTAACSADQLYWRKFKIARNVIWDQSYFTWRKEPIVIRKVDGSKDEEETRYWNKVLH